MCSLLACCDGSAALLNCKACCCCKSRVTHALPKPLYLTWQPISGETVGMEAELLKAAAAGDASKISSLLADGVDVSYQDPESGMSALMFAAEGGHQQVVEMLLEAGCPWNLQDKDGYCAGQYAGGHPALVQLLMEWGVQAELVLGAAERAHSGTAPGEAVNADYLQQKLHYSEDGTKLLDADGEAVMMGWEGPLMVRHAQIICARGGDVMNVGFGLGLMDDAIQLQPGVTSHTIIEAHPDVYTHAKSRGWGDKPGVHLLKGRWQDVIPTLIQQGKKFDGIFFDTYGEFYGEMSDFHEQLPKLLKPGGIYSFFNGLAPDNLFFHMVYGRLAQLELGRIGLATTYEKVPIQEAVEASVWDGVKNKYWHLPFYFLPTCVFNAEAAPNKGTDTV